MAGNIPLTVADSNILERWLTHRDGVQGSLRLAEKKPLAYATRLDQPELHGAVDAFVADIADSSFFQRLYKSYFEDERRIRRMQAAAQARYRVRNSQVLLLSRISPRIPHRHS